MDERLDAGRHHIANGENAVRSGRLDEGRSHFSAALFQFASPELRIGEAHARRGLAVVEAGVGNTERAERHARQAVAAYRSVTDMLVEHDTRGVAHELARDAKEGEGAALVVLAELLIRAGSNEEARSVLALAHQRYDELGDVPSAGGVWVSVGRLQTREGNYALAEESFGKAIEVTLKSGDLAGRVRALLALAEMKRLVGDVVYAAEHLEEAREVAARTADPALEGRVAAAQGLVRLQLLELEQAAGHYREALPLSRKAGDTEMEAFGLLGLGEVESRSKGGSALDHLVDGARLMGSLRHRHGLGVALLRIGEHGLRTDEFGLALVAGEAARRLMQQSDPHRGVGQTLRVIVKAFAGTKNWPAAITAAYARAAVAGEYQQNAYHVRDFYRQHAPKALIEELDALDRHQLLKRTNQAVDVAVAPLLEQIRKGFDVIEDIDDALVIVESLAARLPVPAEAPDEAPELASAPEDTGPERYSMPDVPQSDSFPVPEPEAAQGYDGLYSPPVTSDDDDDTDETPPTEPADEPADEALAKLVKESPPGEYASLYSPPEDA